jgi:hypothetical protein
VVAIAVERDERGLGIAPGRDRAVMHARAGGGSASRARPPGPGAWRRVGQVAEVAHQRAAVLGGDRLGVELDAPQRTRAVLEAHHYRVRRPRRHAQVGGRRADHERVVAHGREPLRDARKQPAPVVPDRAQAAVHHLGRVLDRAAGHVSERLMAEADTQHGHAGPAQRVERHADVARVLGSTRAGRDHDVVGAQRRELLPRELVVAHDDRLVASDLAQQVEEVEGERVVVVDQERAHGRI